MKVRGKQYWGFFAACALLLSPGMARAGVITVYPDQLTQDDATPIVEKSPRALIAEGRFFKILDLPLGAVIDRFRVTYSAGSPGYDWCPAVARIKPGEAERDVISYGREDWNADPPLPAVDRTTIEGISPGGVTVSPVVRSGYRYYLNVDPDNALGAIHSIQVIYR